MAATLEVRVARRFKASGEVNYWEDAVKEVSQFNSLYAQVERNPQDATVLRKCVIGTNKHIKLAIWAGKCLTKTLKGLLLDAQRTISKVAKDKEAPADELLKAIHQYKNAVQEALDSTAPEDFNYQGFKIRNEQHISDELCRKALEGVDFLKALFKKRGVESVLDQGVARILLVLNAGATAFFHSGTKELTLDVAELSKGNPGRFLDSFSGETVLHEFGHYVHRNYITGEAAEAWDAPWEGLSTVRDKSFFLRDQDPKRNEQLDPLEIVTEYGKTDKYEDFAETFLIFMAAPEKLTPTAKFRMQKALSLSGLYGKPVMRLASDLVSRVVAGFKAAKKALNLADYGLEGMTTGQAVTLYHGTTRFFKAFDISKSRDDLVNKFYGAGIFLTPSKRVAEKYANANRNIGFDPEIIDDLKQKNPAAGAFMQNLFDRGDAAWEDLTPEALGVAPEDFSAAVEKAAGGVDPNTIADVCRFVIGSKLKSGLDTEDQTLNIFNTTTGLPDYAYDNLDEIGLDSTVYRPKVYTVSVTVKNPLVTSSKPQAKGARSKGYDSVVYYGTDLVGGVPEVAVFRPSDAKIVRVEPV